MIHKFMLGGIRGYRKGNGHAERSRGIADLLDQSEIPQLFLAIALLTLSPWLVSADDTLDQWVDIALNQNQEVVAARRAWEAAQQRAPQARSFMDPMVGVEFMRMGQTRFDDVDTTEVMVAQQLPWFGKRRARIATADGLAEATGFRYLETMRAVRARVIAAYWQLWAAQRAVEISEENLELLTQFEKIARARYEAGQGLQADLLRAQVGRDRLESDLLTLEQEHAVAQARINRLLSAPVDAPRKVAEPTAKPALTGTPGELQADALRYYTRLRTIEHSVTAREAAVRSARLEYAPNVEFRVMARQHNGQSGFQEYDTGVAINVPWLWRGKYRAGIREAEAERDREQALYEDQTDKTLLAIQEYYTAADAGRRTIRLLADVILPRSQEFLQTTRAAYESGNVTLLELINAQQARQDAKLAYERARASYATDVAKLEEITQPWTEREIETGLISPDMIDNKDTP